MRQLLLIGLMGISCIAFCQSKLQLDGHYLGDNLYVQNPLDEDGFCIDSVFVNGQKFLGEIMASAFEIVIDSSIVKHGDSLHLDIHHRWNCRPKILTTTARTPSFEIQQFEVKEDMSVEIKMQSKGVLVCFLQQYRWNKWVKVSDEFYCKSELDTVIQIGPSVHSGTNEYRLAVQLLPTNRLKFSNEVVFDYGFEPGKYSYNREEERIYFPRHTMFELYDAYGNLIKKGVGKFMSTEGLKKGAYYLNFDNENVKVVIKDKKKKVEITLG